MAALLVRVFSNVLSPRQPLPFKIDIGTKIFSWHHRAMPSPAKSKVKPKAKPKAQPKGKAVTRKPAKPAAPMKFGPRKDLGAPVDGFFAKQPPHIRPIVDQLRALIAKAAPEAQSSIKWGMPFYEIAGNTV